MKPISFTHIHCRRSTEGYSHQYTFVFDANEEITEEDLTNIILDGLIRAKNNTDVADDTICHDTPSVQIDSIVFTKAPFYNISEEVELTRQLYPNKSWKWAPKFIRQTSGPTLAYNKLIGAGIRTHEDLLNVDPSKLKQFGPNCITYACGYMLAMGLCKTADEAVSKFTPPKGDFSRICRSAEDIAKHIKAYIRDEM